MRFDILSNKTIAERAMREDLLRKKYKVKEERARADVMQAETARMRAGTEATREERLYGPTGLRQQEISRRFPYGVPEREATTARIKATTGAEVGAGELGLERERFEFGKRYLEEYGESPGGERERDDVSFIRGIAGEEGAARMGGVKCPEGFKWDGKNCVPTISIDRESNLSDLVTGE